MVASNVMTVHTYLDERPPPRRIAIERVRPIVRQHLPPGFVEPMAFGMIAWEVPLTRCPHAYNGRASFRSSCAAWRRYDARHRGSRPAVARHVQRRSTFAIAVLADIAPQRGDAR